MKTTLIMKLKGMIARYEETRDLRLLGGYSKGGDPELDHAMDLVPRIYDFLCQTPYEMSDTRKDPFRALSDALMAQEKKKG